MDPGALHRDALVVDTHVHGPHFVPQPWRAAYRLINQRTMPADASFDVLAAAGVDAVVGKAVGDPVVTRWYRGGPWRAVCSQLDQLRTAIGAVGGAVATDAAGVRAAHGAGRPALILGLEGADCVGDDIGRVDQLHELGVRVVVPVHLGDNQLGSTCLPWQRYVGPLPVRPRRAPGLTEFGRAAVGRMFELGIVVDVSHCDSETLRDIVGVAAGASAGRPVIASHSGARACQDFPRFVTDEEARLIAGTGGVIGLWPYRFRQTGIADMPALIAHARHLADVVGPEHLCLGTDMNGVPGTMAGYRGETDLPLVTAALLAGGFSENEVRGILGLNFMTVLSRSTTAMPW